MTVVYTVIGAQIETSLLEKNCPDLTEDSLGRVPALGNFALLRNPRNDGNSYLCSFVKSMEQSCNDILTVIYQDAAWMRDELEQVLRPLNLWIEGQFGVWVIPVWEY
jgi:hypothetical protein